MKISLINTIKHMKSSKGYTLLFAVIVSVMVLSIAAFILSVTKKQLILSASARDSIYAFYAADSGFECALENLSTLDRQSAASSVTCGNNSGNAVSPDPSGNSATAGTSTFYMYTGTGNKSKTQESGAGSCAKISVSYFQTKPALYDTKTPPNLLSPAEFTVTVVSRGYNIGWDPTNNNCDITGPRKVERALEYTQYQ